MPNECTVDLQGGSLDAPCGLFCSPFDYLRLRRILQVERNRLVSIAQRYADLVGGGKAQHTAATRAAIDLANGPAWQALQDYGDAWADVYLLTVDYDTPSKLFARLANDSKHAACDVSAALIAAGDVPPLIPDPPPAPTTLADLPKIVAQGLADAAGYAVIGAVVLGGLYLLTRSGQ